MIVLHLKMELTWATNGECFIILTSWIPCKSDPKVANVPNLPTVHGPRVPNAVRPAKVMPNSAKRFALMWKRGNGMLVFYCLIDKPNIAMSNLNSVELWPALRKHEELQGCDRSWFLLWFNDAAVVLAYLERLRRLFLQVHPSSTCLFESHCMFMAISFFFSFGVSINQKRCICSAHWAAIIPERTFPIHFLHTQAACALKTVHLTFCGRLCGQFAFMRKRTLCRSLHCCAFLEIGQSVTAHPINFNFLPEDR